MAKLYFKYGSMGSSKTAQALITKYNYEENGMHVWLDQARGRRARRRDHSAQPRWSGGPCRGRSAAQRTSSELYRRRATKTDVIIVDECQFLTPAQIDQLRDIVDVENIPVHVLRPAHGFPVQAV